MAGLLNAKEYMKKYKARSIWHKALTCMAAVVVFCTTYALVLPALTLERPADCGYIEHVHNEACYVRLADDTAYEEQTGALAATQEGALLEEPGMEPDSAALGMMPEADGTSSSALDFIPTDAPAAAEPEITDSTDQSITGSEGLEGSEELTCGKAEGEGAHTHGEGCYNEDGQLICTKAESSGHQHNQFCYGWELICELEEHTHTDACFPVTDEEEEPEIAPGADPTADVEAAADWEATLPSDLPENGAEAVIAVAESQLGYRESADNFIINDENMKKGYTRYGAWYGNPYGDWCAMFVSFCLHYGGVTDFPQDASCPNWVEKLQAEDLYRASGDYTPKAGDLVFYDHDGDGGADHVGLVSELLTEERLAGENLAGDWEPDDQPADQEPAADADAEQNTDNVSADSATAPSADENTAAEPATDTVMAAVPSVDSAITEELMAEEPLIMGQFANQLMAETAIAEYHATGKVVSGDTEATDRVASQNVTQAQQPAEDEAAESQPADSTPGVEQPADEQQTGEASADQATEANDADQSAAAEAPVVAIKTIEGNVGNQVQYQVHRIDDERILGYGVLPDTAPNKTAPNTFQWSNDDITVTVSLPEDAALPADAHIEVETILPEGAAVSTASNTAEQQAQLEDQAVAATGEENAQPLMPMALSLADDTAVAPEDEAAATDNSAEAQPVAPEDEAAANDSATEAQLVAPEDEAVATDSSAAAQPEAAGSEYDQKKQLLQDTVFSNGESIMRQLNLYQINLVSEGKVIDYPDTTKVTVELSAAQWPTTLCPVMIYFPEDSVALMELDEDDYLKGTFETDLSAEFAVAGAELLMQMLPITGNETVDDDAITVHKTIDALRGNMEKDEAGKNADNPDTKLDNQAIDQTDLYRLYLDVAADPTPVDLVIVVDQSGSMKQHQDMEYTNPEDNTTTPIFRDEAVRLVLNGTYTRSEYDDPNKNVKEDGLIYQFLAQNPDNNVAVVEFHGYPKQFTTSQEAESPYTWNTDAGMLLEWTSDENGSNYVDVEGRTRDNDDPRKAADATNYCAGLYKADDELKASSVAGNEHKKVMIFISDGVPTQYLEKQKETKTYYYKVNPEDITRKSFTAQAGDWVKKGIEHKYDADAEDASNNLFDTLFKNQDITVHTIGIATSGNALTHMATNGGGNEFTANNTDELRKSLEQLIGNCTELKIQDTLSDYVDLYGKQPDFKVTKKKVTKTKDPNTGKVTETVEEFTLAETEYDAKGNATVKTDLKDNYFTLNGKQEKVLTGISYDSATKQVIATFNPNYKLEPGCTYTLSFNVETTDFAYDQYRQDGHYPLDSKEGIGDLGTDYTNDQNVTNDTSSGQPGYHSNDNATATYKRGTTDVEKVYPHPVIQVDDKKLVVEKKWYFKGGQEMTGGQHDPIEFTLFQHAYGIQPPERLPTHTVTVYAQKGKSENIGSFTRPKYEWRNIGTPKQLSTLGGIKQGSEVALEFVINSDYHDTYFEGLVINNGEPVKWQSDSKTYTYSFTVTEDTTIYIRYKDGYRTAPEPSDCSISVVSEPPEPQAGSTLELLETKTYGTFELSSDNDWQKVFDSLPQKGTTSNGIDVDYYTYSVVEKQVEGYTTSYGNNKTLQTNPDNPGIATGTITIKNKSDIEPGYELPETGGRGVDAYITAGLLLMTAAAMMLFYIKIWRRRGDSPTS